MSHRREKDTVTVEDAEDKDENIHEEHEGDEQNDKKKAAPEKTEDRPMSRVTSFIVFLSGELM